MREKYTYLLILLAGLLGLGFAKTYPPVNNPASNFIESLNEEQYERAVFTFRDSRREIMSYLPGAMTWRPGLRLSELTEEQDELLFDLLEYSLSEIGYSKVKRLSSLKMC